ncbi:ankyrin repeat domain-containing protein [Streptomyces sp. NPDC059169]|uniref:ankyrin repeat domain-containing protein n=1 Tax=unclassified Streptomyces TaxID=2593676 RepID=UPI00369479CC
MRTEDLFRAVQDGDDDAVVRALRAGAPAEAADGDGTTALYAAAARGRVGAVRLLLAAGADPDRASGTDGAELPLCGAAAWGHAAALGALLAAGARPDLQEEAGVRALTWACRHGHARVLEALLASGADPDLPGPGGEAPLVTAARRGSLSCVRALLEHRARAVAEALAEARRWLRLDVEQELHRGLVEAHGDGYETASRQVEEDGGVTVVVELFRDGSVAGDEQQTGHAAITTVLEAALGERTPFEELAERALRSGDARTEDWAESVAVLWRRVDEETFRAAAAWCATDDPLRQTFAADVLAQLGLAGPPGVAADGADAGHSDARAGRAGLSARIVPLLRELSREASDPELIQSAVLGLGHHADPAALPEILRHADHPDPEVRHRVALSLGGLVPGDHAEGIRVLIALSRDTDAQVRDWATTALAGVEADSPLIRNALADRLDDGDADTESEAARGLAMRQDLRAVGVLARLLADGDPDGYAYSTAREALEYLDDERIRLRLESVVPRGR